MLNFLSKHFDIKLIKSTLAFALIYCVLFNSSVIIHKFGYYKVDILVAILELVKDFIYAIIMLFLFFFGLSIHRTLFIIGSLFLFITGAVASYYLFFFSLAPTKALIPSIFDTNPTEMFELTSARILVWLVFSIAICLYSIKHFNIQTTKMFVTRFLSAICLLIVVSNIIAPRFSYLKSYFPTQYLHNSYIFLFGYPSKHVKEDISKKYDFVDASDENVVGVFVIGEAARYDKFAINGYERDTTPNLSKIENLASFKAEASANTTYTAVPSMLSRFTAKDIDLVDTETSILSILTRLGFETIWMGTQSITKFYRNKPGGSFYDELTFHMIPGGSLMVLPNSHDKNLLPHLDRSVEDNGKKFIVLHATGSHWSYGRRYPKEFAKFTPDLGTSVRHDASTCNMEELLNSYDNSILYTDDFLSGVIEKLKDKKAFFIYVSDHGESLGEKGRLTHGHEDEEYIPEQRIVPMFVWVSDSYKQAYPEKWAAIAEAQLNKTPTSHDHIFHTVLDCLNINSKIVDKSLSLCHTPTKSN